MKSTTKNLINNILSDNSLGYLIDEITFVVAESVERIKKGGKVVVCGNGGSAADRGHIVGELMKGFVLPRKLSYKDRELFISNVKRRYFRQPQYYCSRPSLRNGRYAFHGVYLHKTL